MSSEATGNGFAGGIRQHRRVEREGFGLGASVATGFCWSRLSLIPLYWPPVVFPNRGSVYSLVWLSHGNAKGGASDAQDFHLLPT